MMRKVLVRRARMRRLAAILLIDAAQFRRAPDTVLHAVQEFLRLPTRINFTAYLEYNPHKGFHCLRSGVYFPDWPGSHLPPHRSCLGSSKGRPYPRLNYTTEILPLLRTIYASANRQLYQLLQDRPLWRWWLSKASGQEYPTWLTDTVIKN
ncbi:unnamed protein product [Echinostoma caproni]|uniref:Uncharacterized protein n=1 Tax=Echinostoma caproni TaxID=27848 RepID=A0A183AT14_9TREM|nr:unnamed protein product [Echinostoma caproni]